MSSQSSTKQPLIAIECFKTAAYQCSYLPEQQACSEVVASRKPLSWEVFSQLIQAGYRRSGFHVYKPSCDACSACIPVRIDVAKFKPNRSQRRVDKKYLTTLKHRFLPCEFYEEHYQLYLQYQHRRHMDGPMDQDDIHLYLELLESEFTETFLLEFRNTSDHLKMVSLIDLVEDGISAVYTFYEPNETRESYGTFGVLTLVRLAQQMGLSYVYLGYLIEDCDKMSYKRYFSALQQRVKGKWCFMSSDLI